ncbi:tetratricopeptide repeat protein [Mariniflexile fucanivorans]|uniref:Tetratricopeptide repeat protein n=1 Tax=Mariniflexile fucanivorans TaxID=264023 RepID=A0A4R1RIP9_9FLAO|nr:tetratricopeptide repeat protein [Mariniflexile fucanivorans]TCL65650.1 tetratricopeptide repeat protein [Mariniflexile fucanivorans]
MKILFILCFLFCTNVYSQDDEMLAREYYKNGDFEKALFEYKKLYAQYPNYNYVFPLVSSYQELEQYDEAQSFLIETIQRFKSPAFMVELGYNYQLKNDQENASLNYNKALESINANPINVNSIVRSFQSHSLINEAVLAYEKAMVLKPEYNYNLQLAQLYGEQGNIEKMFTSYIDFAKSNPNSLGNIKRAISDFTSEDSENENNIIFRKILLKKAQQEPDVFWNEWLSWLFIQQNDFKKAFAQEKAIFNRYPESLYRIEELAGIALSKNEPETAKEIYTYITATAQDLDILLEAHYNLIQLETKQNTKENYDAIDANYQELFNKFGTFSQTLQLQIAYAHFLAFYKNDTKRATAFLEKTLELPLSEIQQAEVKLELGDILVLQEKFNDALIYYTQIQRNVKNSTISQEARFKVAKASYYKGDFKWAESQLKILKASTSQLIANDALDLKLLITDNKYEDSLQIALKKYAKADLLSFQNRNEEAIALLETILKEHKTEPIIPQALFKLAQLFEDKAQFEKAEANYNAIITNYGDGILVDDAYFKLAELYENKLNQPEKAKTLYEKIIFNHADSIYFIEARKKYRALRGDAIN